MNNILKNITLWQKSNDYALLNTLVYVHFLKFKKNKHLLDINKNKFKQILNIKPKNICCWPKNPTMSPFMTSETSKSSEEFFYLSIKI